MKFTLPMPPSINQTYGVKDDVFYKRKRVKQWEHDAGWEIKQQKVGGKVFTGSVQVGIDWFYSADRDIDAGIKVLLDLLEKQYIVNNDRQIRRITHIDIYEDKKDPRVEIEIEEME